jgi:predicted glycosyltransferase
MTQADEFEAIKARHEADCGFESDGMDNAEWRAALTMLATRAHADRATLLRLLDAARAELAGLREAKWTDDDQRSLIAAVYDAVWHWGDTPMDTDDTIVLAEMLKDKLQENGLRLAAALKEKP